LIVRSVDAARKLEVTPSETKAFTGLLTTPIHSSSSGVTDGLVEGRALGVPEGRRLGLPLGLADGRVEGICDGITDGDPLGRVIGLRDGLPDGTALGAVLESLMDWVLALLRAKN
jgi:hypothetical protein